MVRERIARAAIIVVAVCICVVSFAIHDPSLSLGKKVNDFGLQYSDIVYGVFMSKFVSATPIHASEFYSTWLNTRVAYELLNGTHVCPLPYRDYSFEYPPLVGALWALTTCTAMEIVLPQHFNVLFYKQYMERVAEVNYVLQSIAISAFMVLGTYALLDIASSLGAPYRRVLMYVIAPSTAIYSIYNWDAMAAAFSLWGLRAFMRGQALRSGLLIGLGGSTMLIPFAFAIPAMYDYIQRRDVRGLSRFTAGLVLGGAVPFIVLALFAPQGFLRLVDHYASWFCENCIFIVFIRREYSVIYRALSIALMTLLMTLTISIDMSRGRQCIIYAAFLSLASAVVMNYIFTPQMWLMLSPLAVLIVRGWEVPTFIVADLANAGIILAFFKDLDLRIALSKFFSIPIQQNPWSPVSPVQWIAQTRNLLILAVFIAVFVRALKHCTAAQFKPYKSPEETLSDSPQMGGNP